ncbi:UNC93-like protein 3 isoform X2 [Beta vulgaris subsp. vulgaris]|uniref:UNC93-like protein 3 isoform X2 n=1 Tax=Beta vulgaris subsp. vulgaris TaxID=3555 RepID=UPI002036AF10|nr:UNC93-like protein 3 isoform X2 [Beta vulgaris subsp. vulgaris]
MGSITSPDENLPLVDPNAPENHPKSHSKDVHILSLGFLLVFSAYGAVQNLESTVNDEGDLGTISLGILVLVVYCCKFEAELVHNGPCFYLHGILCFNNMGWTDCSLILFLGCQGTYLTSAARSHARDCNLHEGTVIGNFNGEFWGIYATHQVIGNLLALFLLKDGEEGNTSGATMLFFVFLCILTFGCILMCFLSRRDVSLEQPNESSISCFSFVAFVAKSVVTPLFDTRILLIIPLFAYSGLQQAFVWAEFTKKIVKPALGESGIGGSMAVYGAADAICSLVAGRMTSSVSSVTWITLGGSSAHAIILLWILLKYSTTSGVLGMVYPLIMAAALGIGDGVMMTQINALLGMLFKHDMEGAFAQLKVWQSFSIAVVFFLTPYISLHVMAGVMLIALCIALASFFILTLKLEKGFSPR